jgi:hypothetical protein
VPGHVEELTLTPFSHNISVNWKQPISDSYCVMQYVIYWVHALNGNNDSSIVEREEYSYVIGGLDACVEYKVSVRAVNEENDCSDAATTNTTTGTVGNYYA